MSAKTRTLLETEYLKVLQRGSNGAKNPAHVVISLPPIEGTQHARSIKITMDELFDITEALDDICDEIEDREDERALLTVFNTANTI